MTDVWSSYEGPPPRYMYPLANAVIEHLLELGYVLTAHPFSAYYRGPRVTVHVSRPHPKYKGHGSAIGYIDVGPGPTELEVLDKNKVRKEFDAAEPTAFNDLVSFLDRK